MKVEVSSPDVDQLIFGIACLRRFRELVVPTKSSDGELDARIAIVESVLDRIITEAMMASPVVQAALAEGDPFCWYAGEPDALYRFIVDRSEVPGEVILKVMGDPIVMTAGDAQIVGHRLLHAAKDNHGNET